MNPEQCVDLAPGSVFQGKYEVVGKISRGGFGTVYKARQLSTGQLVAIKCLHRRGKTAQEDAREVARFQREVKFCAMLHHPNIVRLIDTGQTKDELFYMAFEYIPGETLRSVLSKEGCLDPIEAGFLMTQVLDALSYAHSIGIVHRDLKPNNIMITPGGARRSALVLDFGIGAFLDGANDEDKAELSNSRECLGTPLYCAPEQLHGGPTSMRSDLYSWGLVFYECLTGQRAITGTSFTDVVRVRSSSKQIALPSGLREHPIGNLLQVVTAKEADERRVNAKELMQWLGSLDLSQLCLNSKPVPVEETLPTRSLSRPEEVSHPTRSCVAAVDSAANMHKLVGGEHKQLTGVSCSFDILPAGADTLEVEASDALILEQKKFCRKLARRHGGHIVEELHNRVIMFFGYPRTQHDVAIRAVRAAVQLRDELRLRSAMVSCSQHAAIEVRVGVHTGLVTIREQLPTPIFSGTTAGIAAQIDAMAPANAVVISEVTKRLVERHVVCTKESQHKFSGQSRTMEIFTISGEVTTDSFVSEPEETSAFYDREFELARLRQQWKLARNGNGQSALVIGSMGIGKTRLLGELKKTIGSLGGSWLECHCSPEHQDESMQPVVNMFEHKLGYHIGTDPIERAHNLKALLEEHRQQRPGQAPGKIASMLPALESSRGCWSHEQADSLTMGALVSLLLALSERAPFVVAVEDLHWADERTLEFLSLLLTEAISQPIYVVMTARPNFRVPWNLPELEVLRLGNLSKESAGEMIETMFSYSPLPDDDVLGELSRLTNGVPLYIREMSRVLIDAGRTSAGHTKPASMKDVQIPSTLRDSLAVQLERAETFKPIAEIAAVLGPEFSTRELAALVELPIAEMEDGMRALIAADIVCRRRHLGGEMYSFRDPLVHRVAYESLPPLIRRKYHERIACTLSEKHSDGSCAHAELLAHHLAAASYVERALECLRKASYAALCRGAAAEALACASKGLRWLDRIRDGSRRNSLELMLQAIIIPAMAVTRGCTSSAFVAVIDRSKDLLDVVGTKSQHAFAVWYGEYLSHIACGRYQQAENAARRYLDRAQQRSDDKMILVGQSLLGSSFFYAGRLAEARDCLLNAIEMYRARDSYELRAFCGIDPDIYNHSLLSLVLATMGNARKALALIEETLKRARRLEHPLSIVCAIYYSIQIWQLLGAHERIGELINEWLDVTSGVDGGPLHYGESLSAVLDKEISGDMPRGWDERVAKPIRTYHTIWVARNEAARNMHALALSRLDACLSRAFNNGEGCYKSLLYYHKAICLAMAGHLADAETSLRRAIFIAKTQGAQMLELRASIRLCGLLLDQGKMVENRKDLQHLYGTMHKSLEAPLFKEARIVLDRVAASRTCSTTKNERCVSVDQAPRMANIRE